MVCGGFSCSKNCLCALNLLYTVSSPPRWHLRGLSAFSPLEYLPVLHPAPLAGFPRPSFARSPRPGPRACLSQSPPVLHCGARPSPRLSAALHFRVSSHSPVPPHSLIPPHVPISIPLATRSRLAIPSGAGSEAGEQPGLKGTGLPDSASWNGPGGLRMARFWLSSESCRLNGGHRAGSQDIRGFRSLFRAYIESLC